MAVTHIELGLIYLATSLVSGFCSSAPLGPINLWLVDATIRRCWHEIYFYLAGVIIVDIGFAAIALWGYFNILNGSSIKGTIALVGGVFLIFLGILGLYKLRTKKEFSKLAGKTKITHNSVKNFFTGAMLCGSNPAFLMFWIFIANLLNQRYPGPPAPLYLGIFLLGVGLGDGLWFGLLIKLVSKGLGYANPKIVTMIRYMIALGFVIFGIFTLSYRQ